MQFAQWRAVNHGLQSELQARAGCHAQDGRSLTRSIPDSVATMMSISCLSYQLKSELLTGRRHDILDQGANTQFLDGISCITRVDSLLLLKS